MIENDNYPLDAVPTTAGDIKTNFERYIGSLQNLLFYAVPKKEFADMTRKLDELVITISDGFRQRPTKEVKEHFVQLKKAYLDTGLREFFKKDNLREDMKLGQVRHIFDQDTQIPDSKSNIYKLVMDAYIDLLKLEELVVNHVTTFEEKLAYADVAAVERATTDRNVVEKQYTAFLNHVQDGEQKIQASLENVLRSISVLPVEFYTNVNKVLRIVINDIIIGSDFANRIEKDLNPFYDYIYEILDKGKSADLSELSKKHTVYIEAKDVYIEASQKYILTAQGTALSLVIDAKFIDAQKAYTAAAAGYSKAHERYVEELFRLFKDYVKNIKEKNTQFERTIQTLERKNEDLKKELEQLKATPSDLTPIRDKIDEISKLLHNVYAQVEHDETSPVYVAVKNIVQLFAELMQKAGMITAPEEHETKTTKPRKITLTFIISPSFNSILLQELREELPKRINAIHDNKFNITAVSLYDVGLTHQNDFDIFLYKNDASRIDDALPSKVDGYYTSNPNAKPKYGYTIFFCRTNDTGRSMYLFDISEHIRAITSGVKYINTEKTFGNAPYLYYTSVGRFFDEDMSKYLEATIKHNFGKLIEVYDQESKRQVRGGKQPRYKYRYGGDDSYDLADSSAITGDLIAGFSLGSVAMFGIYGVVIFLILLIIFYVSNEVYNYDFKHSAKSELNFDDYYEYSECAN
jgi:hypothetical protein